MKILKSLGASAVLACIAATGPAVAAGANYTLVKTINLPGGKGGHGDWVAYDGATKMVWLSQSPDHNVVVIDTGTNTIARVLPGIASGNVVEFSPQYAFVSDADGNNVAVFDKRTLARVATLEGGGKTPDGMIYDAASNRLFVTYDDSNNIAVFEAAPPFAKHDSIALQPEKAKDGPDVPALVNGKILQPDDNLVDVIDTQTGKLVAVWKPAVKGDTKPIVFDVKSGHLFMGTTDKVMLVLDPATGAQIGKIPLRGSVDETTIDADARRAFVGDKAGVVEVIDLDTAKIVGTIPSERNAHTLTVDPTTHRVYNYRGDSNAVDVFQPNPG